MPELLLALDAGTSHVGAALFSPAGDFLASAAAPVRSRSPRPGWVEQNARRVWHSARAVMGQTLDRAARNIEDVAAIGVTSQRASIVCWDRRTGRVLGPLVSWSDLRGASRAGELRAAGFTVVPQMAAAKLESVVADIPDAAALSTRGRLAWGNVDAYLIWKLSGGALHITDRSQAWPTGYLNLGTMGWNAALIEHQGLDAASFPTLVDTWGPLGVTSKAAIGAEIPMRAVVADQQSALIAHGGGVGSAKVTYGTSATLNVDTGAQLMMRGASIPPFVLSSVAGQTRFCLEGMVYSAGAALDWLRRVCGLGAIARFEALAAATPDAGGAYFLPALQGLGAPHGDFTQRGLIGGLSAATTPGHLARAGLEGVAFRVREAFDHVYAGVEFAAPDVLCVDGGLTGSDLLMQTQADLLGRPVARHAVREATACGAAICAGRGAGLLGEADIKAFARYDRTFEPRIGADEADARFAAWRAGVYSGKETAAGGKG
jgi:glycerol kinase